MPKDMKQATFNWFVFGTITVGLDYLIDYYFKSYVPEIGLLVFYMTAGLIAYKLAFLRKSN
jgi:hypothetical protein